MRLLKKLALALPLTLIAAAAQVGGGDTGSISGTIVDENGNGIEGASVIVYRLTQFAPGADGNRVEIAPAFRTVLATDSLGNYSIAGLAAGEYNICGYGIQVSDLGSCDWVGVPDVTLSSGQGLTGINRTVLQGVSVTFNISDPNGRLQGGAKFRIGLGDQTFYQPATGTSVSSASRVFKMYVPKNRTLRIFIDSDVQVVGEDGTAIQTEEPSGAPISSGDGEPLTINLGDKLLDSPRLQ